MTRLQNSRQKWSRGLTECFMARMEKNISSQWQACTVCRSTICWDIFASVWLLTSGSTVSSRFPSWSIQACWLPRSTIKTMTQATFRTGTNFWTRSISSSLTSSSPSAYLRSSQWASWDTSMPTWKIPGIVSISQSWYSVWFRWLPSPVRKVSRFSELQEFCGLYVQCTNWKACVVCCKLSCHLYQAWWMFVSSSRSSLLFSQSWASICS